MAASGFTPIQPYYSTTATTVPLAANMVTGELALNTNDGKLYFKNNSGVVTLIASTASTAGVSITGILKSNGTTISAAVAGTDYIAPPSGTAILKANSGGALSNAVAGTDYAAPTSGTAILYGNGAGGFSSVTIGSNLTFVGGTLTATSGALTYFTEAQNTSSPNATIPVSSLTAKNASYTNIDTAIVAKGTGAILAQVPDGSSSGGTKRGTNAVDFQMSRTLTNAVAQGNYSALLGGANNQAFGTNSAVIGGLTNSVNGTNEVIIGGTSNSTNGTNSFIGGGSSNATTGATSSGVVAGSNNNGLSTGSFIGGGYSNYVNVSATYSGVVAGYNNAIGVASGSGSDVLGRYSFMGGGYANILYGPMSAINGGTRNQTGLTGYTASASGTTSLSSPTITSISTTGTAIKVGQIVVSTGSNNISDFAVVTALTSTTVTMSKNANAAGSTTFYFYDSFQFVGSGYLNTISGTTSCIGGGYNNTITSSAYASITGGYLNSISADTSTIAGGSNNSIATSTDINSSLLSSFYSTITGTSGNNSIVNGNVCTISGSSSNSAILSGYYHTLTGNYSTIVGGQQSATTGNSTTILGGFKGADKGIYGFVAIPGNAGIYTTTINPGNSQAGILLVGYETTDGLTHVASSIKSIVNASSQLTLKDNSALYIKGSAIAYQTGAGPAKSFYFTALIKRGSGVATTALVGTPTVTSDFADAAASGWTLTVAADTTYGCLKITISSSGTSTATRWVCKLDSTEVGF